MSDFQYTVLLAGDQRVTGIIEAETAEEANHLLEAALSGTIVVDAHRFTSEFVALPSPGNNNPIYVLQRQVKDWKIANIL